MFTLLLITRLLKKMSFFITNPELDKQISEIRRRIMLSMNGEVTEQMTRNGILYKKNYGVDIPRLKQIAALYRPNHDLAQRLWNLQIRETMILATLLEPVESFTPENANRWLADFSQTEIIEQVTQNLLSKLPYAETLCLEWINTDDVRAQTSAFLIAARIYNQIFEESTTLIIDRGIQLSTSENYALLCAIARCLSRLCRKNEPTMLHIEEKIQSLCDGSSSGKNIICEEVKQEIIFLRER